MARIAFDIDDTVAKIIKQEDNYTQVPDYDLIQVMRWFINNGDEVYAWSAGGVDYTESWLRKLGLFDLVKAIPKLGWDTDKSSIDIAFDDCEVGLAKVNIIVKREKLK